MICQIHRLLCSTALASVLLPAVAHAQTSPTTASAAEEIAPPGDEIVVTGIRASAKAAQQIKRDAPVVVEVITFQDLGKFTDPSITDALQRVPGVNVERNVRGADGGDGVTIRGLGPGFLSTTLNGRELLGIPGFGGGGGRQFDFGSVPPEILGGITVYKTSSAELIEPGLAGQVNIQTLRPLDFRTRNRRSTFASLSVSGQMDQRSGRLSPRIGGVVGAKLFQDTLGVYVSALYSKERVRKDEFLTYAGRIATPITVPGTNGSAATTYSGLYAVNGLDSTISDTDYQKKSVALGLQWKPSAQWEIVADIAHNEFVTDKNLSGNYFQSAIGSISAASVVQPGAIVVRDGAISYFDTSRISGLPPSFSNPYAQRQVNTNKFTYGGINVAWKNDSGKFEIAGDYSHGDVDYFFDWKRPNISNQAAGGNDIALDVSGVNPVITFSGPAASAISNPESYTQGDNTYFEVVQQQQKSRRDDFKLDLKYRFSDNIVLKLGARHAKTTGRFIYTSDFPALDITNILAGTVTPPLFPGPLPAVSFEQVCAVNAATCNSTSQGKGSFTGPFPTTSSGNPGDVFGFSSGSSYDITEKNTAVYAQLDLSAGIFRGNAGVRAVRIQERASGFRGRETKLGFNSSSPISSETTLITDTSSYWNYLPSANLTISPTDNINLRAAAAKTISLASFSSLIPRGVATIILPLGGVADNNNATVGNTRLRPTTAWNYDLTAAYYNRFGGSIVASLFYKDVTDLVTSITNFNSQIPGEGATLFDVTTSVNAGKGHTYGAELGVNQPLTFLPEPFDGLGIQANYTYVKSKTTVNGTSMPFPGSSKHNINLSAYYEKSGYSARAAYNYRTEYLVATFDGGIYARAVGTVDVSLTKKLHRNLELIATGINVTGSDQRQYSAIGSIFRSYFQRPTLYSLALRFSF